MYDGTHPGTIVMNLIWVCFNMVILGVATAVAWESQQRRQTVRVTMAVSSRRACCANGTAIQGVTADLSSGGVMMRMDRDLIAAPGDAVRLTFPVLDGDATLPATVVGVDGNMLRAQFDPLTTAGRRGADDGALLACRYLAGLGRGARGGPSADRASAASSSLSMHGLCADVREA